MSIIDPHQKPGVKLCAREGQTFNIHCIIKLSKNTNGDDMWQQPDLTPPQNYWTELQEREGDFKTLVQLLVNLEQLTVLPEHLSFPLVFNSVCVVHFSQLCVYVFPFFVRNCDVRYDFLVKHCSVRLQSYFVQDLCFIHKCQRIPKVQSKMHNQEKLATQITHDENKKQKQKHYTICVEHRYTETSTNNVNKTRALLQTFRCKDEPKIVIMRKSYRTPQHGTQKMIMVETV